MFLQDAMGQLGMSREDFANRISVSKSCLQKWMSRHGSSDFRQMPLMAWKFVNEILEHEVAY
ncbi:hypothetical protein CBP36_21325 (plasmid) [Acidovorax carolinensis]|uniref:Transcriptional regulator n=1 Tax=Acidovorax carolinensis TaxID=553814 RepID=A0A240UJ45_9BURK|nr:hypothetical protein CBP36_21325 [Acidovorax carolinensis]